MESYIKSNIENSYIYFNKTNDNQKLFILQIQLNTKYETTELFNIILLSLQKPISPKAKNHHTGIIKKVFYIDENSFTDDFQYLFLYIDKI